jgi:hypothetical protein
MLGEPGSFLSLIVGGRVLPCLLNERVSILSMPATLSL